MIKKIEAKIKEKLESISDLKQVFEYYKSDFDGFPYAGFEFIEGEGKKLDTCTNIRTYQFGILIFQESGKAGRETAKNIIYSILEKIIFEFDADETLGGLIHSSEVVNVRMNDGMDDNKGKGLYGVITLNFNTLLSLY